MMTQEVDNSRLYKYNLEDNEFETLNDDLDRSGTFGAIPLSDDECLDSKYSIKHLDLDLYVVPEEPEVPPVELP